jgi:hypothetical protein
MTDTEIINGLMREIDENESEIARHHSDFTKISLLVHEALAGEFTSEAYVSYLRKIRELVG